MAFFKGYAVGRRRYDEELGGFITDDDFNLRFAVRMTPDGGGIVSTLRSTGRAVYLGRRR